MSTRILLTALFATALTMPALAQPATATPAAQPPVAPAAPAAVTVEGAAPTAATVSRDKDTLSVDFPDEEIKTILRNVADLFELNLVVPDTLTGKTSIKLRDVSWRQIFKIVLDSAQAPQGATVSGWTYVQEGNVIKIVSNADQQQEPATTEVFILNNAKAADIKPTIDGLIDAATGGKIVIDARSNALVITERPSHMGRIRTIIDQLDKATDQVMIESKFVEVSDSDIHNIGLNWAGLNNLSVGVGKISQTFGKSSDQNSQNSNTVNGGSSGNTQNNSNTNNSAGNTVTYVSAPNTNPGTGVFATSTTTLPSGTVSGLPATVPSSTSLANYVAATATTPATATALNTFNGSNLATTLGSTTDTTNTAMSSLLSLANTGTTSRLATAVFSASDFNVIISALKTESNSKVVSNPTIVTLNNTEASINIGSEFPVPSYTYNSERGAFEVSGFTYKPIGIILKVTPQVNARGVIKLNLEPEISAQTSTTTFGGAGGAQIPIIDIRKVKTQVSLKDGYTMGLGGLIKTSRVHGGTKVPVLGDIPILGRLFSSKSVNDTTTNLLIFVTAKTVSADGASPEEVFDPRIVQAAGMTRDDLPGNRVAKGTDMFAPAPAAPAADK